MDKNDPFGGGQQFSPETQAMQKRRNETINQLMNKASEDKSSIEQREVMIALGSMGVARATLYNDKFNDLMFGNVGNSGPVHCAKDGARKLRDFLNQYLPPDIDEVNVLMAQATGNKLRS